MIDVKIYKLFAFPALLLGIALMIHSGHRLFETEQIYQEGNAAYNDLSGRMKKPAAADGVSKAQTDEATPENIETPRTENIYIPDFEIDFEALRTINKDAAAWLYGPGTAIDYPVMKADDYSYYLEHLPDGTYNANGSLFIDYNSAPDFTGRLTVIYGHHMKSGKMFGSLKGYKNQAYYDENPFMYLYTGNGSCRIDLIYGCVIGAGQWRERAFMYEENIESLLSYAALNTTFKSGADYGESDRIVALSTCSYEFDGARYVVIGVLD